MILATFPSSLLAGFIRRHLGLILKFSLCSFIVMQAGLYILSFLGRVYGIQNVGVYQDECLACFRNISGPASDKTWKDMIRTFRENSGLKISITTNLKPVNFLDLTFNLAQENTNLIRNRMTHLLISMSTQTIRLISSRHYQIAFHNK